MRILFLWLCLCLASTSFAVTKKVPLSLLPSGGTDLQIRLTVYKGAGTDNAQSVYVPDCRSDFADIRFYAGTSSAYTATELPYWVYSLTADTECTYYVKLPTVSADDTTYLYVISGTSHSTHESNPAEVFVSFDNFAGSVGTQPSAWSVYTTGTAGAVISDDVGLIDLQADSYTGTSSVVGASSGSLAYTACRVPHQRMCFIRNGVYYVFVCNFSTMYVQYRYSTDGTTWSSPVDVFQSPSCDAEWDIEFDGTYIHYCRNFGTAMVSGSPHRGIKYGRGTFNADNSITFGAETEMFPDSTLIGDFNLAIDANGYPWLSYGLRYYGQPESEWNDWDLGVNKSSTKDGTWSDADGFPVILADFEYQSQGIACPFENGNMYIVEYQYNNDTQLKGYMWDYVTQAWSNEGTITTYNVESNYGTNAKVARVDAVAYNNEVHVVYTSTTGKLYYLYIEDDGTVNSETELAASVDLNTSPRLSFGDNRLYVTWADYAADDLSLKVYSYTTLSWGDTHVIVPNESFNENYAHVMASLESYGGVFNLCYLQSDYDVVHQVVYGIPTTTDINTSLETYCSVSGSSLQVDKTFSLSNNSLIEFDINIDYVSVGSDTNDCFEICRSFNTAKTASQFCPIVYGDGNRFGYLDGSGHHKIAEYDAGTWYTLRVAPDYDTHTYRLDMISLSGQTTTIGTPSFLSEASAGNFLVRIAGTGSGHTGLFYLDNFRILNAGSTDIVFGSWEEENEIENGSKMRVVWVM